MYWMYESESDEEKDRPEMRCKRCDKIVEDTEKNLTAVLKTQSEDEVGSVIESLAKVPVKIDIKLYIKALNEKEK